MSRPFQQRLTEFLQVLDQWLSDPEDSVQQEEWMASAEWIAHPYEFSEVEQDYVDHLLGMFREQHEAQLAQRSHTATLTQTDWHRQAEVDTKPTKTTTKPHTKTD